MLWKIIQAVLLKEEMIRPEWKPNPAIDVVPEDLPAAHAQKTFRPGIALVGKTDKPPGQALQQGVDPSGVTAFIGDKIHDACLLHFKIGLQPLPEVG